MKATSNNIAKHLNNLPGVATAKSSRDKMRVFGTLNTTDFYTFILENEMNNSTDGFAPRFSLFKGHDRVRLIHGEHCDTMKEMESFLNVIARVTASLAA